MYLVKYEIEIFAVEKITFKVLCHCLQFSIIVYKIFFVIAAQQYSAYCA